MKKNTGFFVVGTTAIKKNNFGNHLSNTNTFETLCFFCEGENTWLLLLSHETFTMVPSKKLSDGVLSKPHCLLFNIGDKVATRRTQKTEEADKIKPYRLDKTRSGGGVIIYHREHI